MDDNRTAAMNDHLRLFDRRLDVRGPNGTSGDWRGVSQTAHQAEAERGSHESLLNTF